MFEAVEIVHARLLRTTAALTHAGIPHAVIGDQAVSAWIARTDESAVRNTFRVGILLDRINFEQAKRALGAAGFLFTPAAPGNIFLDGPDGKLRNVVQVFFAEEKLRPDDELASPSVSASEQINGMQVLDLESLVQMQLVSHRTNDKVNVRDLIDVGLVDDAWVPRLPRGLQAHLRHLLDTPDG